MHQNLYKCLGALVAGGLLCALPASGEGLLGERYLSLSYDSFWGETAAYDDGSGFTLTYNQPYSDVVDIGGSFEYLAYGDADGRDELGDFSDQRLLVTATAYEIPQLNRIWVRFGLGLGMVEHGDDDDTNVAWAVTAGTEYAFGETVVLYPYLEMNDVWDDGEDTTIAYGVQALVNAGEKFGATLGIEGDQKLNWTLSIGGVVRF